MADNMIFFGDSSLQRGRRKHVRFEIKKPVEFKELDPEETEIFSGQTRNMSEGGILFASPNFVPVGSHILFMVHQERPHRVIAKALCKVLRVNKSVTNQDVYEIACQNACKFKTAATDDWNELVKTGKKELKKILPDEKAEKTSGQEAAPKPRKKLEPVSICPGCGNTVTGGEKLCMDCQNRIVANFNYNRFELFGKKPQQPPKPAPVATIAPEVKTKDKPKAASKMTQTLNRVTDNAITIIEKLGRRGDTAALPYLKKAAASNSRAIAEAAHEAIELIEEKRNHKTYS